MTNFSNAGMGYGARLVASVAAPNPAVKAEFRPSLAASVLPAGSRQTRVDDKTWAFRRVAGTAQVC